MPAKDDLISRIRDEVYPELTDDEVARLKPSIVKLQKACFEVVEATAEAVHPDDHKVREAIRNSGVAVPRIHDLVMFLIRVAKSEVRPN